MHLSNLGLQRLGHHLVLLHQSDSSEVWSLNKHLDKKVLIPCCTKPFSVIHLKHAAAATADVDNSNVGGFGEGFCQGANYCLFTRAWGTQKWGRRE